MESPLFNLLLLEDFEMWDSDFILPSLTLLFELQSFSGSEYLDFSGKVVLSI